MKTLLGNLTYLWSRTGYSMVTLEVGFTFGMDWDSKELNNHGSQNIGVILGWSEEDYKITWILEGILFSIIKLPDKK